jgi:hypothetical protein
MSLKKRIRKLEDQAGPERCDNCREWNEWVVRHERYGESDPAPCLGCGFQQGIIRVVHTEEAGKL